MPTPGGIGLYLIPNIISWIFVSLFIALSAWQVAKKNVLIIHRTHIYLLLGILLLTIPAFYPHSNLNESLPRILALVTGLLFFTALCQFRFSNEQKNKLLFILLIGVAIEAMIGLLQYYVLLNFNIQITGYTPVSNVPYGTFTQPNVMASFMATGIALALYLLNNEPLQLNCKAKYYYSGIYFCLTICAIILTLLQSKTGYIGLIVVLITSIPNLIKQPKHNKNIFLSLALGISIGLLSFAVNKTSDSPPIIEEDKHRLTMYLVSLEMIKEKPILGFGYGNFQKNYRETYIKNVNNGNINKPPQDVLIHPHNEILFWIIEGGILAGIGGLFIIYSYLSTINLRYLQSKLSITGLIIPILIHTQLEYPFYISTCLYLYFIIFFWLMLDSENDIIKTNFHYPTVLKVGVIVTLVVVITFMLTTIQTSYLMEKYKQSSYREIHYVEKIINPVAWQEYIVITLQTQNLRSGFKTKNTQKLKQYIYWGYRYVEHRPLKTIYNNMLIAIDTLDKVKDPIAIDIKQNITRDAARLHPKALYLKK